VHGRAREIYSGATNQSYEDGKGVRRRCLGTDVFVNREYGGLRGRTEGAGRKRRRKIKRTGRERTCARMRERERERERERGRPSE